MRVRPYLTEEKKIGGAVISFSDVTEMKKLEKEKQSYSDTLEQRVKEQSEQLVASERMASVGRTAGMVGHDIRNPLQAIVNELYLAKQELDGLANGEIKGNLKQSIREVEEQIFYINKIVADLQDYAKPLVIRLAEVDIEETVKDAVSLITIPKNIQVSVSIQNSFPKLLLDSENLKRVLTNLILNSVQAMSDGGRLSISAVRQYGKAMISVEDDGVGMTEEVKKKIFTPLFSTKSKGQGFGLPVVKRLTEAMGGTVTFESKKDSGTKFTLEFIVPK
jgi:signal transduction histidine kinase